MSSPHYDDIIPGCCVTTMLIQGTHKPQPSNEAGCQASKLQDNMPQDKLVTIQKDIPSMSQVIGIRQEATSEDKDHLIKEVNKVDVGTEDTAFVFIAPLLEGEPEV